MKKFLSIILVSVASSLVLIPETHAQSNLSATLVNEKHNSPIIIDEKLEKNREPSLLEKYDTYLIPRNEILARRDRTSQHYRVNDSTVVAILHSKPIYYSSSTGELVPISDKIIPTYDKSDEGWIYRNEANEVFFYFSEDGSKCLIIGTEGQSILEIDFGKGLSRNFTQAEDNLLSSFTDEGTYSSQWSVNGYSVRYESYDHRNVDIDATVSPKIIWYQHATLVKESIDDQREITEQIYDMNGLKILITNTRNIHSSQNENDIIPSVLASTTITLYASNARTIFRTSGGAYSDFSSPLRFQNLSSSGCSYGYRFWVKYNLSSIPDIVEIQDVDQYIYVYDRNQGTFDFLNYDVTRVSNDPEVFSVSTIWGNILSGTLYENNEWVSNPPDWEWSDLNDIAFSTSADEDFENALSLDWFALGYMVECNEDDSDYYALFRPYNHTNDPRLIVQYLYLQPDLVVEDITVDPPTPNQGQSTEFCAIVRNQGDYNSSSTTLRFAWNGTEIGTISVPALSDGGSSKRCIFRSISTCGAGTIRADVDDVPFESNTGNNGRSENLTVICIPVVTSFNINNGDATTTSRSVTLNNSATGSPTQYKASESSTFSDASWQPYSTAPSFTLSSGFGTKTVYFKVRNSSAVESSPVDDSIEYVISPPTVTSFTINNGASSTISRTVTLNNSATNIPTGYKASENSSFSGASWQEPHSTSPSFTLSTGDGPKTVYFKVRNSGGESDHVSDGIVLNTIGIENPNEIPNSYKLKPAYPNPFNPATTIRFEIPKSTFVRLGIYDMQGREIFRLVDAHLQAGYHRFVWNAANVSSGIYLYRLEADDFVQTRKMVLLK